jgi:hydrogenase maturation protease
VTLVVIGVGNPWRADDGAGPEVAHRLAWLADYGVRVLALDGEPARLVEAWDGADEAVVVDACLSDGPAGQVWEVDASALAAETERHRGTHGFGVATAYELGRALGRLPRRLRVLTIIGGDFLPGPGLSLAVQDAVERVAADLARHAGAEPPPL